MYRPTGVIVTCVTPFDADDQIDEDALRGELRYLLSCGVDGICVTGSVGEGNTLSLDESVRVATIAMEEIDGRVPLVAGVIQNSTAQALRYGAALKAVGVDALQVTPIHYLFRPSMQESYDFFRTLGETLDIPIIIYNVVPWAMLDVPTIDMVVNLPHVVSIKQSASDIHKVADLVLIAGERFTILSAVDALLYSTFSLGAHGTLAGIQTVAPQLVVDLWQAHLRGDHAEGLRIHELLLPIWRAVEAPNLPARIKEALRLQGRTGGHPRLPLTALQPGDCPEIAAALEHADLLSPVPA